MRIIIATIKSWNIKNTSSLIKNLSSDVEVKLITEKEKLSIEHLESFNPDYIFFPHWSWIIGKEVFARYECIVFHMTDLPYGRGGSPLQNLISSGIENTRISAIRVSEGIDTGDLYLKQDLNLNGTADEIFIRASEIIFQDMIPYIISNRPSPIPQVGETVVFGRRTPEESEIVEECEDLRKIYDYIRMLDGEGYPKAFIRFGKYRLEFSRASFKGDSIISDVIIKEEVDE